jgi:hypothetical protein
MECVMGTYPLTHVVIITIAAERECVSGYVPVTHFLGPFGRRPVIAEPVVDGRNGEGESDCHGLALQKRSTSL